MTDVRIGVSKNLLGESSIALARIIRAETQEVVNARVPVGGGQLRLELEPGPYLIQVEMPAGGTLSKSVVVGDKEEWITLEARHSDREWLSWSHFTHGSGAEGSIPRSLGFAAMPVDVEGAIARREIDLVVGNERVRLTAGPRIVRVGGLECEIRAEADGPYAVVSIAAHPGVNEFVADQWTRAFLVGSGTTGSFTASLPVPWLSSAAGPFTFCAVDILLEEGRASDRDEQRSESRGPAIIVRDPLFGAVFGYLAGGDPAAALSVSGGLFATALQMLYGKRVNPYAAAAAGYLLLRASRRRPGASPEWREWLMNLGRWFTWLPDGAVLDAYYDLLDEPRPDEAVRVREQFLEAIRRGVPVYTEGVRLLIEGLGALQGVDESPELSEALKQARRWGAQLNPREPFTILRTPQPRGPAGFRA